jgi:hypothetical protein
MTRRLTNPRTLDLLTPPAAAWVVAALLAGGLGGPLSVAHAAPTAADALKLKPVQDGIDYDQPSAEDAQQCKIQAEKVGGATAWVVRNPEGTVLRQFSDSNSDNVVDTWSYFLGGLEIYRDVDANFNGKADEYRWYHMAGTRAGTDQNEDGKIDRWDRISPEEVAQEAVEALRTGDAARFERLLLTKDEIDALGLPESLTSQLNERVAAAPDGFAAGVKNSLVGPDAQFTDFGGLRPGMIPAGTRGSTQEFMVYENVWAMVVSDGKHQQLQLGTLVYTDGGWRLVEAPTGGDQNQVAGGFFFRPTGGGGSGGGGGPLPTSGAPSEEMQQVLAAMEKLDSQMSSASSEQLAKLSAQRAEYLQRLAELSPTRGEQEQWLRQLADMVSAAVQGGQYPQGVARLKQLEASLAKGKASADLQTHFEFRRMQAEQGVKFSDPKANHAKLQEEWLEQLEAFVKAHRKSEHASEALLQLAMYSEFSGEEQRAAQWYQTLVRDFPDSPNAAKAQGSLTRLNAVGKSINLTGNALQGGTVDLKQLRGKAVLIHYWSTAGASVKADHAVLKDVYAKYGGKALEVVEVNLDYDQESVTQYLRASRLPWKVLYEPGGFESRLANEMGVITLPLMVLVDPQGKVVSTTLQAAEVEDAIKEVLTASRAAGRTTGKTR